MKFQESVDAVLRTAKNYETIRDEKPGKEADLRTKYVGEYLTSELAKLDDELANAKEVKDKTFHDTQTALLGELAAMKAEAAKKGAADSLDGTKISPDWKLLELPTVLTVEQVQILADRHQDNPLFIKALKDYQEKHKFAVCANFSNRYDRLGIDICNLYSKMSFYLTHPVGTRFFRDNPRILTERVNNLKESYEAARRS